MRIGENPNKTKTEDGPSVKPLAEITVGVLNCIPNQIGYFKGQLDSLKLCLASLRQNSDYPFDLLVMDNGSCTEVKSYLQNELTLGHIDYLILNNSNIGKANAVLQILRSAPGDLVFYSDGDIFYRPGWIEAHLEVFKAFPEAGMMGGVPLRIEADFHTSGTLRWVEANKDRLIVEKGKLIPDEWTHSFLTSIGVPEQDFDRYFEKWQSLEDCRVTVNGVTAYVGASHAQYMIPRQAIELMPRQRFGQALNSIETQFVDRTLEEAGLMRLSTAQPYVYHIGNTLSEDWLKDEYKKLVEASTSHLANPNMKRRKHWFWGRWSVRSILRWIHEWTFKLYNQNA